jgi:mannose-1-phosphate guanylyltransferase
MHDRCENSWNAGHNWALVLAAGDRAPLRALTPTTADLAVPEQFRVMGSRGSLLDAARVRARSVAPVERTCVVVHEHHRRWWQGLPLDVLPENLIVQPRDRGRASGILLPLLQIVQRDPQAMLLVLPAEHYVRDESVLATSLLKATLQIQRQPARIILLGVTPETPDPELNYIVCEGESTSNPRAAALFVEKPGISAERALIDAGAVWNSCIFAANAWTLLRLFEARCPELLIAMRRIVEEPAPAQRCAQLAELYERLPQVDFFRDVLEGAASSLSVLTVPACGWNDLGTTPGVQEMGDLLREPMMA